MRLIDADALIQKRNHAKNYSPEMYVIGQGYVMDAPTVDAVPVVRGEWIEVCDDCDAWLECNLCGEYYGKEGEPNFCPNCGADMRGSEVHNG